MLRPAFGGFAALLPRYAYLSEEMALADSLTLDGKSRLVHRSPLES